MNSMRIWMVKRKRVSVGKMVFSMSSILILGGFCRCRFGISRLFFALPQQRHRADHAQQRETQTHCEAALIERIRAIAGIECSQIAFSTLRIFGCQYEIRAAARVFVV